MARLVEFKDFNNDYFTVNESSISIIRPATRLEVKKAFEDISAQDGFKPGMEKNYTIIELLNNGGGFLTQGAYLEVRGKFGVGNIMDSMLEEHFKES